MPRDLPIDAVTGEITAALRERGVLVLEAEPGAGKTTRVPLRLLEAGLAGAGQIVVAEPRRLAARLAATHVASELGEAPGGTIGYSVRFEHVAGRDTRILYATEGVLLRRFVERPDLAGVSVLVLDEFHERHLATDLLLALSARLRATTRPDLLLVVMSATLDAGPLAAHLGAARVRSEGRAFPLEIEHLATPDDRPLEAQVASAVRRLLAAEPRGDVLVFLPGAAEIRRTAAALEREAASGVLVLPLHGDLTVAEQARVVARTDRRRVILSTNVAESSVTVDGVTAVVDSGLARVAGHSPWSGLPTLGTARVSRASATQRAGRAGRTQPGRVLRLYTASDLGARPAQDLPELLRDDLSEAFLLLAGTGVVDPGALPFLDPPPGPAAAAATALLRGLGALDPASRITEIGRRMLAFPLSPRLARVVVEGEQRGVAREACLAAALLSERDLRLGARADLRGRGRAAIDGRGPSDVLELMERFREAEDARFDPRRCDAMGIDARGARNVARARDQLARTARDRGDRPGSLDAIDEAVQVALLAGFPDRLARRRAPGRPELILASGRTARLAETSVVHDPPFVIALDADEQGTRGVVVRLASGVRVEWVMDVAEPLLDLTSSLEWNRTGGVVETVSRIALGSVVLEESRGPAGPSAEATALLLRSLAPAELGKSAALGELTRRLDLLRSALPELEIPALGDEAVAALIADAAGGATRRADVEALDLGALLVSSLPPPVRVALERDAPERLTLAQGRALPIHYEADRPPWVESRLQDFFGMVRTPTLCRGRVPLTVHLLAPNHRAVQVTTDLAGFWERHYPGIRRELCRRYPRHPWPEDGRTASPPEPRRRP